MTTATTPPALVSYRSRHTVEPVKDWQEDFGYFVNVCRTDSIRVYQRADGRWAHDRSEIKQLVAFESGFQIDWTIR